MQRFSPAPEDDLRTASRLVDLALSKNDPNPAYFPAVKGMVEYRQGHFESAIEWTRKAVSKEGQVATRDVQAYMVCAMANHQIKHLEEAKTALAKGLAIAKKLPRLESGDVGKGCDWHHWLIPHILIREAKTLIESMPALPPSFCVRLIFFCQASGICCRA